MSGKFAGDPVPYLSTTLSLVPLTALCIHLSGYHESFHHVSHTVSILSGEYPLPDIGTQISMSRQQVTVLMSFVRYHPFLLLGSPLGTLSGVLWVFGPFGLIPSNLTPCCSRKSVVAWYCRSFPDRSPDSPHRGLPHQNSFPGEQFAPGSKP
jgi:hypothetical protein